METAANKPVRIVDCTEPTELYRHYDRESKPQDAFIQLDLRAGVMFADWDPEIGNGRPLSVYHGFKRHYRIPLLTAEAANRIMQQIAPLASRILADWEEVWDGNNHVAILGEDALAAEEEIERMLDPSDPHATLFDPSDLIAIWDVGTAVNGSEITEYGISAETSDERLKEIEEEILGDLAAASPSGVAVCHGLDEYLRGLRNELREGE